MVRRQRELRDAFHLAFVVMPVCGTAQKPGNNEFTAPPGTPKYTDGPNEKYIEATTDERFRIVVKLLRGFNFMGSPKVRVTCSLDQGKSSSHTLSKNKSQSASSSDRSHRETGLRKRRQFIDGRYMDCGLTFGELKPGSYIPIRD